ncbi:hypothetical protein HY635_02135 [Candidatus Uhrbacteria bacterium]|nr:hypothetical protein [Candidatus Uhrbacteria bacterium]
MLTEHEDAEEYNKLEDWLRGRQMNINAPWRHLVEQARQIETSYGQPTDQSKDLHRQAAQLREKIRAEHGNELEALLQASVDLDRGDPRKARELWEEHMSPKRWLG